MDAELDEDERRAIIGAPPRWVVVISRGEKGGVIEVVGTFDTADEATAWAAHEDLDRGGGMRIYRDPLTGKPMATEWARRALVTPVRSRAPR